MCNRHRSVGPCVPETRSDRSVGSVGRCVCPGNSTYVTDVTCASRAISELRGSVVRCILYCDVWLYSCMAMYGDVWRCIAVLRYSGRVTQRLRCIAQYSRICAAFCCIAIQPALQHLCSIPYTCTVRHGPRHPQASNRSATKRCLRCSAISPGSEAAKATHAASVGCASPKATRRQCFQCWRDAR